MGTKKTYPKYTTLMTINEKTNKVNKAVKTEDKIEILTKSLTTIFTEEQNKPHFNTAHKETIDNHIENNTIIFKPLKNIPINYKSAPESITKTDINNKINKLNTKKASGPDKISNKIIQYIKTSIFNIIHNLYNICWFKGYHPNQWKIPLSLLINKQINP